MEKGDKRELLDNLFKRLLLEFGEGSGANIMRLIIEELGGCRITFPTLKQVEREQRDQLIRQKFTGFNCQELGIRFNLSEMQIRRIVHKN